MRKEPECLNWKIICLCYMIFIFIPTVLTAQNQKAFKIYGTIYEQSGKRLVALPFATASFTDYAIHTTCDNNGHYTLNNVPEGKATLSIRYLGKISIDTLINVSHDLHLDFVMQEENFRIKEVVVTAEENKTGQATSSKISRMAMDHLQANSLYDLLSLLPGGTTDDNGLSYTQQFNIRSISSSAKTYNNNLNAMGVSIIQDGAPLSNNANLQTLNATAKGDGYVSPIGGGSSPAGGLDIRSISTDNIESVEVIRGIPSVEYGDLTSGAVIINSKAGREPLRVNAKTNRFVYAFSAGTGFELGKKRGALNISADYAHNTTSPIKSYLYYERFSAKALYSNTFLQNKLKSNTSLDIIYGKNRREKNPDDEADNTSSRGTDIGFILNTNGQWSINKGWLKNLKYVVSAQYTGKKSYYETNANGNFVYSQTTTDGAVLSNKPGQDIYDADGNKITNFQGIDEMNYALHLPTSYVSHYNIDGKELNIFSKVTANFFKRFGNHLNNRILLGVDFKTDGNLGNGKTYFPEQAPTKPSTDAAVRMRRFKDVPFVNQFGLFAEENFNWTIGNRNLRIQAGARYDRVSVAGDIIAPRINASFEVIPRMLTIRGGYGITAKMPTVLYLHPEQAYFEYTNLNEMGLSTVNADKQTIITTTKVYDASNKDLKVAKNHKAEIGFDLRIKQATLSVTAFSERLKNGYSLATTLETYRPFSVNSYKRNEHDLFELEGRYPVLASFSTPTNNRRLNTKGLEFDLNLGRFDAIRTSFVLNGAWMKSESYTDGYTFYETGTTSSYDKRNDIGIYQRGLEKYNQERISTSLRITHNIPRIGFVVTLTTQVVWKDANWYKMGNDSIPVGYISKTDASAHYFEPGEYTNRQSLIDAGYNNILRNVNQSYYLKESYSPYCRFNLNVTKEIGDYLRISFFANNMFRSYPMQRSKRNPGIYTDLNGNNRFTVGLELSLLLK